MQSGVLWFGDDSEVKHLSHLNDHHSFAQHDAIVRAIRERDQENAAAIMKTHLEEVRDGLIRAKPNAV
jgi:DNA-binding GntR family transcriptional regulator